ncbi:MAG: recombinase family protein [Erythrobacter sp.]
MQTTPPIREHRSPENSEHPCALSARKVQACFPDHSDLTEEARLLDRLIGDKISALFAEGTSRVFAKRTPTMMQVNGKNVAIYAHAIGVDKTENEKAISDQLSGLRNVVQKNGGKVVKEYADVSTRASDGERPAYQQMAHDANTGQFQIVAVWSLSRISRDPATQEKAISALKVKNVEVVSMTNNASRLISQVFGGAGNWKT